MPSLKEITEKRFGASTTVREETIDVMTAPYPILKNNPRRVMAFIQNTGPEVLYFSFDPNFDISLAPFLTIGGTMTLLADEDGEMVGYELWGATAGGDAYVVVWEVILL